ncbi:MAG: formylglycine-generating enzyme family protein [Bdellovibrionota bacterium]
MTRWIVLGFLAALALGPAPSVWAEEEMAKIPGGKFVPLYGTNKKPVKVKAFWLDRRLVSGGDFLKFVEENPSWRCSAVKRLFADEGYLQKWRGDLEPGEADILAAPVVQVSWFSARAYCRSKGKRLPHTEEWELAALADETRPDASADPAFGRKILEWYSRPTGDKGPGPVGSAGKNFYGVYDLHGLVWEWTEDFNSIFMTGESRADRSPDEKLFCGAGAAGTADPLNYAGYMRYAFRSSLKATHTVANLGFRCARDLP